MDDDQGTTLNTDELVEKKFVQHTALNKLIVSDVAQGSKCGFTAGHQQPFFATISLVKMKAALPLSVCAVAFISSLGSTPRLAATFQLPLALIRRKHAVSSTLQPKTHVYPCASNAFDNHLAIRSTNQGHVERPCSPLQQRRASGADTVPRMGVKPGTSDNSGNDADSAGFILRWKKSAAMVGVVATLFGTGLGLISPSMVDFTRADAAMAPSLMQDEKGYISIFEKSTPGVVYINTFVNQRDAFSMNVLEVPAGTGSGFVWDNKGHVVTNFHVIRQAQSAQVRLTLKDGTQKTFQAQVKGFDPDKDVAVLKIDADSDTLRPIPLGVSGAVKVGQLALAIGNPFGLDHTLTMGVVSGLGREVKSPSGRPITNVIQTDAAINPGNSGGPLLDSLGRIVGMNTAIYSPSGGSAGIGFAIPIDTLKTVVSTIIARGRVSRPMIGITFLESARANTVGIQKGVLVLDVAEGTSAASAGLRPTTRTQLGDIIVAIDDQDVNTEADLFKILEARKPGDVITITAQRITSDGTETLTKKIELQEANPSSP